MYQRQYCFFYPITDFALLLLPFSERIYSRLQINRIFRKEKINLGVKIRVQNEIDFITGGIVLKGSNS